MKRLAALLVLALLPGCAYLNSVALTPIPAQRGRPVTATVSRFIFLGLNFDNDYIEPIVTELKRQCEGGVVSGILTKDEIISYFLAHTHKVTAKGYCNTGVAKNGKGRGVAGEENDPAIPDVGLE